VKLKTLFSSNPLTSSRQFVANGTFNVICADWIRAWRMWIAKPGQFERPGKVNNESLLCKDHQLLTYDLTEPNDLADTTFCFIQPSEWEVVEDSSVNNPNHSLLVLIHLSFARYPESGPSISMMIDSSSNITTRPPVCHDCRNLRYSLHTFIHHLH
jgi:hypothetical protein